MNPSPIVVVSLAGLLLGAPGLDAQSAFRVSAGAVVGGTWLDRETSTELETSTGVLYGATATIGIAAVSLDLDYRQSRLSGESLPGDLELVVGEALVRFRPAPWVSVAVGPQAVGYVTDAGTERWLTVEARARVSPVIVRSVLRSYVEVRVPLSTDVNVPEGTEQGLGVEGGLLLEPAGLPLRAHVGYRVDRSELSGLRRDTREDIVFALGLRTP